MKKRIILTATTTLFLFSACNSSTKKSEPINGENTSQIFNLDTTNLKSGETFYQCEMNPEVLSDKAGNCPKCRMELSEMKKQ